MPSKIPACYSKVERKTLNRTSDVCPCKIFVHADGSKIVDDRIAEDRRQAQGAEQENQISRAMCKTAVLVLRGMRIGALRIRQGQIARRYLGHLRKIE